MQQFKIFRALGLSFKAWFKNFIPFTLLAAILYAPVVIWVGTYDGKAAETMDALLNAYFVAPVYIVVGLSTLLPPLITYRVIQDLNGVRVSMLTSIKFGLRGILPAVILAVVTHLLQYIPAAGGIVSAIMMCVWFVATPVAVAERTSPFAAFTRSAVLTSGRRWGIFGLSFLVGLVVVALMLIWIVPMFQRPDDAADALANARQAAIMFVIIIGVFRLFSGIVEAVSYVLLREDKDGVTAQELAKIFE